MEPQAKSGAGPVIGIIIIIIVLILGAYYFWAQNGAKTNTSLNGASVSESVEDVSAIESDLNSVDVNSLNLSL